MTIEKLMEDNLRLTALLDEGQYLVSYLLGDSNITVPYEQERILSQWTEKANAEIYRQAESDRV